MARLPVPSCCQRDKRYWTPHHPLWYYLISHQISWLDWAKQTQYTDFAGWRKITLHTWNANFMTRLSQTNTIIIHFAGWRKTTDYTLGMQAGKCYSVQSFRYSVSFACQKSWNVLEQICKVHSSKVCTQLLLFSPACYGHGHSLNNSKPMGEMNTDTPQPNQLCKLYWNSMSLIV